MRHSSLSIARFLFYCFFLITLSFELPFAHEVVNSISVEPSGVPIYEKPIVTFTDFISISLTAITVLLAMLGVGLGMLAFYTLKGIKESASASADRAVKDGLRGIRQMVRGQVSEELYKEGLPPSMSDAPNDGQSQDNNN